MSIYIISYPRSGNTAFRYILEMLTGRPTNGLCGEPNPKDRLQRPLIHRGKNYVAHKRHDFKGVQPEEDMVIFILRDPLEAVVRHNEKPRGIDTLEKMRGYLDGWFSLLRQYDEHRGEKMVIYYQELVKVADRASLGLYPDAQSDHADYHKGKLSQGMISALRLYMSEKHGHLVKKYLL